MRSIICMRILLATENYHPNVNGSSIFTQRLAEYMSRRGHTVRVVKPSRYCSRERYVHHGAETIGIGSLPLFVQGFRTCVPGLVLPQMRKIVADFKPDIVHVQDHFSIGSAAIRAAKRAGIPVMGTNHFMPENVVHYLHLPGIIERLVKKGAWAHFRSVYGKADCITTPTMTAAGLLKNIGLRHLPIAVSCGIDLALFHPGAAESAVVRKYSLPQKKILLTVCRLDKEKQIDLVLRAFAALKDRSLIQLVLAGKGAEEQKLHSLAKELGLSQNVSFLGYVPDDDLPSLYRAADCFLIAGIAELQSIATLEAMATGLPVIAADAMALPELVKHGRNGYLFPPHDVSALTKCIELIFEGDDRRKAMSLESLNIVSSHAISHSLERYEELYAKLINTPRS